MSNSSTSFLQTPRLGSFAAALAATLAATLFCVTGSQAEPAGTSAVPAQPVQFTLQPMTGPQIRNELLGTYLKGEYSSGKTWSERLNPDLTSFYAENGSTLRGRVSFTNDHICFTYSGDGGDSGKEDGAEGSNTAINGVGGCFEVWKRGANCYDFYSTSSPPSLRIRRLARNWLARAWKNKSPSTCQSIPVS